MRLTNTLVIKTTAIVLTFFAPRLAAAEKMPKLRYIEEHTNTDDVQDIAVFDDKVWFATHGGVSVHDRKDGRFLFKLTSIHGLFGNRVNRLKPTPRGTLLAAGDFGVAEISKGCARPSKECFASIRQKNKAVFDPIVDIVESTDDILFLSHQSGLHSIKEEAPNAPTEMGMWRAAAKGKSGILTGGMDGRLMRQADASSAASELLHLNEPVVDIVPLDDGFILIAGTSIKRLEGNRLQPVLNGSESIFATALSERGGKALAGEADGGIFEIANGALKKIGRAHGRVTAILDDGDVIWLGIAKKGPVRFSRKTKTAAFLPGRPAEICSNHVTRMTKFKGRLTAGSFDNGACVLRENGWQMLDGMAGQYVHGVAQDGKYLWVATSNGIARYDENLAPVPVDDNDPKEVRWFKASAVTALAELKSGAALGSPWGVVVVTRNKDKLKAKFVSEFRGAPPHLTSVTEAPGGLFISSETNGVHFAGKRRKETKIYLDPVHLPEAWILDVSASKNNGFWAASCQNGVSFVGKNKAVFIDASKGLSDNRTIGVAAYKNGAFVATLNGLSFATENGAAVSPFNGFLPDPRGSGVAVRDNTLFFATESGTAVFAIDR